MQNQNPMVIYWDFGFDLFIYIIHKKRPVISD